MDRQAVLAAFDMQIRRLAGSKGTDNHVEYDARVVRSIGVAGGWSGVTWSDLDDATAESAIVSQIRRFAQLSHPWEWKHYSYDRPLDLAQRLVAAGFIPERPRPSSSPRSTMWRSTWRRRHRSSLRSVRCRRTLQPSWPPQVG